MPDISGKLIDISTVAGLYAHVPFCNGKCDYCAFYSVKYQPDLADRFLAASAIELARYTGLAPKTIYVGGGTPTVLDLARLERLCGILRPTADAGRLEEWTVEANPGTVDEHKLRALRAAGVNRLSIGIQSLDDVTLRKLGRRHTAAQAIEAFRLARAAGFRNLSVDLIACVPGVTLDRWLETVRHAVALAPEHISVYALTVEEGSRLAAEPATARAMPDEDEQLEHLHAAAAELEQAGLRRYEISNFARPGFKCRHNLDCWRGGQYLGIGPAAASHVDRLRWTNSADLGAYLSAVESGRPPPAELDPITDENRAVELLVFGLRMTDGVAAEAVAGREPLMRELEREELATFEAGRWRLTARGMDLADAVAVRIMD